MLRYYVMIAKQLIFLVFTFFLSEVLVAQYTQIPDPEFEWLLVFQGIDTDGLINGQVALAILKTN